ncbi:MAG: DUF6338 family protein [Proteobacteria bacterium]|nr:DUF6338 family protein [Pseudomonadota bacterium]
MGEISKDVLTLLTQLMPGFLTAWVVYGLTTYTKPIQFERLVQALIYSFIVNALVSILEKIFMFIGRFINLGVWDNSAELITSTFIAVSLGIVLSYFMSNDSFFGLARRLNLTSRTAYPSEWYGAFATNPRYIVLHLEGSRRIYGYPIEWPTESTSGHFRLTDAAWLNDDNTQILLETDDSILIPAKSVEMVEFLKDNEELDNGTKNP